MKVKIVCGANSQEVEVGGNVGAIRKQLTQVLNIPKKAKAYVGKKKVRDGYTPKGGETLEFKKDAGSNG